MGMKKHGDEWLSQLLLSAWHLVASLGLLHPQILALKVVPFKGGRSPTIFAEKAIGSVLGRVGVKIEAPSL